jgi:hypothetical protein
VEGRANEACIEFFVNLFAGAALFRHHCLRPEQTRKSDSCGWALGRGTTKQDGIDPPINSVMQAVPISVLGIPLAFVFLATSAVWSGETTRSCCRRTRCQHDASGDLYGAGRRFRFCEEALCIIGCAPNPDHEDGYRSYG